MSLADLIDEETEAEARWKERGMGGRGYAPLDLQGRQMFIEAVERAMPQPEAVFPAGNYACNECGRSIELTEIEATAIEGVPYCGCDG